MLLITILSLFFLVLLSPLSHAEEKELSLKQMLLSPGDLTEAHADIETKCNSCHVHFEKSNQTPLCLDCHEKINSDLQVKSGFHGRISKTLIKDCKNCHTDHQGREFDTRGFDQDNFDHNLTNFKLEGKHARLECLNCHKDSNVISETSRSSSTLPASIRNLPVDKAFRFKAFKCVSCHVDFHKDSLGDKCENCHNSSSWKSSQFDHDKTDFSLTGEHENITCESCHINNQFKKTETQCKSCHLAKEPHLGIFGKKCGDCHTSQQWKNDDYNHFKETGYKLIGHHFQNNGKKLACINCHSEKLNPAKKCLSCHQNEDVHQGSNGAKCADCHNQKSWKKTDFTHSQASTGFALTGAHKTENCDSCHTPGTARKDLQTINAIGLIRSCIDCHQAVDPHFGKLGKDCSSCHQTKSWQKSVRFNHDFTDFPLTGSHQLLVCESCHLSSEFSEQSQKCQSCHSKDDIHQKTLGNQCESCHDTSVWSHWNFDHQQQTNFSLNGKHQNLKCNLCHRTDLPDGLTPGKDCYSCHRNDDIHSGGFGIDCQQCHTEDSFDELNF